MNDLKNQEFFKRLLVERDENAAKIAKLKEFFKSDGYKLVGQRQTFLLNKQCGLMTEVDNVLRSRIDDLNLSHLDCP